MSTTPDPTDVRLSYEQAARFLREIGRFPQITPEALAYMSKEWAWGPRFDYEEGEGPSITMSELMGWLRHQDELAARRRRLHLEELGLKSLRPEPLWVLLMEDSPGLDTLSEVLNAYGCKVVHVDDIDAFQEYVDGTGPDAALILTELYDQREVAATVNALVRRGIYVVLYGDAPVGISEEARSKCGTLRYLARGNTRSPFSSAPSHLALRMKLNDGLKFEHQGTLQALKEAASNGW